MGKGSSLSQSEPLETVQADLKIWAKCLLLRFDDFGFLLLFWNEIPSTRMRLPIAFKSATEHWLLPNCYFKNSLFRIDMKNQSLAYKTNHWHVKPIIGIRSQSLAFKTNHWHRTVYLAISMCKCSACEAAGSKPNKNCIIMNSSLLLLLLFLLLSLMFEVSN